MKLGILNFRNSYYGWVIVAMFAVISMVAINVLLTNYGLFIPPIHEELGIGHAVFGWAITGRWLGIALSSVLLGRILDAFGTRRPLVLAAVLVGGFLVALSRINVGWQMVVIFALIGAIGLDPIGGNLYAVVSLSNWFNRQRGRAMSIVFMGVPVGIFFIAPLTQMLIDSVGWRDTLLIMGVAFGGIILLATFFLRDRPREGELAAYEGAADKSGLPVVVGEGYAWTRGEALRTPTFWKLALSSGFFMFANSTVATFRIPFYVGLGIDAQIVAYAISMEALVSFFVSYPIGYAMQRLPLRYLLAFTLLLYMGFFILLMNMTSVWQMFLAQAIFGLSIQGRIVIESTLWPNYFGERNIGSIRGLSMPLIMGLGMIGAPLAGIAFDTTGSYFPAWWVAVAVLVVSVLLLVTAVKPRPPHHELFDTAGA